LRQTRLVPPPHRASRLRPDRLYGGVLDNRATFDLTPQCPQKKPRGILRSRFAAIPTCEWDLRGYRSNLASAKASEHVIADRQIWRPTSLKYRFAKQCQRGGRLLRLGEPICFSKSFIAASNWLSLPEKL